MIVDIIFYHNNEYTGLVGAISPSQRVQKVQGSSVWSDPLPTKYFTINSPNMRRKRQNYTLHSLDRTLNSLFIVEILELFSFDVDTKTQWNICWDR